MEERQSKDEIHNRKTKNGDCVTAMANKHDSKLQKEYKIDESGGIEGVENFEDLLEVIGPYGRWNITMIAMICCAFTVVTFQIITYQFLGATPDHWCHVDELSNANWTQHQIFDLVVPSSKDGQDKKSCKLNNYNYTAAVEFGYELSSKNRDLISLGNNASSVVCYSRDFNTTQHPSTIVTEWDLVCERRALYSTTMAVSQIGILIGSLVFGYFMDLYGRKPIIIACVFLSLLTGLGAAAAPMFSFYVIMKTLVSCFMMGYSTGLYIYLMELCTAKQRTIVSSISGVPWAVGYMMVAGIAYLIRPWRWMQATYSAPIAISFALYWLLPESPRWLVVQGRYDEAIEILTKAAKVNGRPVPSAESLVVCMERMKPQKKETPTLKRFLILIIKPEYRSNILICFFCWCAVAMVYYGVSLNSDNLSTDPYMYVFLGGLAELPPCFFMWILMAYLGRRNTLSILLVVCGVNIAIVAVLLATQDEVSSKLLMFLSLTGKMAIGTAFAVIYLVTAELFPTQYRSLAIGESSTIGRIGSISSPYINDIMGAAITWGPSALFAVMSFLAGAMTLLLPETGGNSMAEECKSDKAEDKEIQLQRQAKVNEAFADND